MEPGHAKLQPSYSRAKLQSIRAMLLDGKPVLVPGPPQALALPLAIALALSLALARKLHSSLPFYDFELDIFLVVETASFLFPWTLVPQ